MNLYKFLLGEGTGGVVRANSEWAARALIMAGQAEHDMDFKIVELRPVPDTVSVIFIETANSYVE